MPNDIYNKIGNNSTNGHCKVRDGWKDPSEPIIDIHNECAKSIKYELNDGNDDVQEWSEKIINQPISHTQRQLPENHETFLQVGNTEGEESTNAFQP